MFARLIAKLFAPSRTPIRIARRTRLNAESLEARDVPATFWWGTGQGSDPTSATIAANWTYQYATADDPNTPNIVENEIMISPGPLPSNGDDVIIGYNPMAPSIDGEQVYYHCTGFTLATGYVLNSLSVGWVGSAGYNKTFTLGSDVKTKSYYQASGYVSQPATTGRDITVTETYTWVGGVQNSSGETAKVTVTGANATGFITPTNAGSLETGSHVIATDGSTISIAGGTVTFKNESDLIAEEFSTVSTVSQNKAQPTKLVPAVTYTKNEVIVRGAFNFSNAESELPIMVYGGTVHVPVSPLSKATGDSGAGGGIPNQSVMVTAGALVIDHGATLEATNGVGLLTGKLATRSIGTGAQSDAKIKGNLINKGADVVIGDAYYDPQQGMGHRFGVFLVDGTVTWSGGTYRPAVRAQNPNEADLWKSTGLFAVQAGATFAPGAVNQQGQPTGYPPAGQTWKILESDNKITGNLPPQNPVGWTYTQGGNPNIRFWYVVS